jgi:hypothetical protein
MNPRRVIAVFATAFVVGLIVLAIGVAGTPADSRATRNDQKRSSDLATLAYVVEDAAAADGTLPPSLAYLVALGRVSPDLKDPATGAAYEYRTLENGRYELCAAFERTSATAGARPVAPGPVERDFYAHGAGRTCFALTPIPRPKTAP